MNRAAFFTSLRRRNNTLFGTSLSQKQVEGVEAILDECQRKSCDLGQTAYILATAYGETGGKMQPRHESLYYTTPSRIAEVFSSSRRQGKAASTLARKPELLANTVYGGAWGADVLGNTEPGDGWRFRGTGMGQITGRYNFTKWSKKMGLPLVTQPELLMQLDVSVRALVQPMLEGWATGLSLPTFVRGRNRDYVGARKVWNGTFEAEKYAGYAQAFEAALDAGGWNTVAPPQRPVERPIPIDLPAYPDTPEKPQAGLIAALLRLLAAIFGRKDKT